MFHFHEPRKIKPSKPHHSHHQHPDQTNSNDGNYEPFTFDSHEEFVLRHESDYLLKESGLSGLLSWRKKWFVLSSALLSYYDNRDDSKPKEVFDLSLAVVGISARPDKDFCFFLRDEKSDQIILSLAAESEEQRQKWVEAIRANSLHEARLKRTFQDRIDALEATIEKLKTEKEKNSIEETIAKLHRDDLSVLTVSESLKLRESMGLIQQENTRLREEIHRLRMAATDQPQTKIIVEPSEKNSTEIEDLRSELNATKALLDRTKAERKILKDECIRLRNEANNNNNQPINGNASEC